MGSMYYCLCFFELCQQDVIGHVNQSCYGINWYCDRIFLTLIFQTFVFRNQLCNIVDNSCLQHFCHLATYNWWCDLKVINYVFEHSVEIYGRSGEHPFIYCCIHIRRFQCNNQTHVGLCLSYLCQDLTNLDRRYCIRRWVQQFDDSLINWWCVYNIIFDCST